MTEKDYLLLIKKHIQSKRVICGFNEDSYHRAIVVTGVPKEYNDGHVTYVNKRAESYENYVDSNIQRRTKRC